MRKSPPAVVEIPQERGPDRDPAHRIIPWVVAVFVLFQLAMALVWMRLDNTPPYWDEAWYLYQGVVQHDDLRSGDVAAWVHDWLYLDRTRPCLVPTLTIPYYALFGISDDAGLVVNLAAWPIVLLVTYALGTSIGGRRSGLLACLLIGSYPVLIGLVHILLVEMVMVTLVAGTLYALWRSGELAHRRWVVAAGILSGLGILTKVFFVVFVIGPWLLTAVQSLLHHTGRPRWRGLANLGLGTGIAALIAASWYTPNLGSVVERTLRAGLGSEGTSYGVGNPRHWTNLVAYLVSFAGTGTAFSGFLALMAGAAGLFLATRSEDQEEGVQQEQDRQAVLFLASSAVAGYTLFTCLNNQDLKHVTGILPALAVLSGWGITKLVRRRWAVAASIVLIVAVFQTIASTTPGPLRQWQLRAPVLDEDLWFFYPAQPGVERTRYAIPDATVWPLHDVLSYALLVADLESLNRSKARVAVLPDYPGFETFALLFEATRHRMPVAVRVASLSDLQDQDVVIHKTGELGWDPSEPAIAAVTQAISDTSSGLQRMPRTFALPDGSEALIFGRRHSPLLELPPSPGHPSGVEYGGAVRYLGFDVLPSVSAAGDIVLDITHYWESLQATEGDYAAFVHLLDPQTEAIVAQDDHALFPGTYPTSLWQAGRFLFERRQVEIPASFSGSDLRLRVGLYNDSGRLPVSETRGATEAGASFADVGLIRIEAPSGSRLEGSGAP